MTASIRHRLCAGICTEKALMLLDQQPVTVVKHISVKQDNIADVLDRLPRANVTDA